MRIFDNICAYLHVFAYILDVFAKNIPKRCQNGSKKLPKLSQNGFQNDSQNRPWEGPWTDLGFARVLRDFGVNLNSRPGAQNGAKNDLKNTLKKLPPKHAKISLKIQQKIIKNHAIR